MSAAARGLDGTLAALADPTRRGVIELLRERPRRAGDIADALGMSAPAMSRHLRVLRGNGLVCEATVPEDGRVRMYVLVDEPFAELSDWAQSVRCYWTDPLAAFKLHAEAKGG